MRLNFKNMFLASVSCLSLLLVVGCTDEEAISLQDDTQLEERSIFTNLSQNAQLIGLSPGNELVFLKAGPPVKETGSVAIQGMRTGENILAIDMQPGTGGLQGSGILYGVSNQSTLYRIDPATGAATALTPDSSGFTPAINGDLVAFEYDVTDGLVRLTTNTGQNLKLNPLTGKVELEDTPLKPTLYNINSSAIAAKPGGAGYRLYFIDLLSKNLMLANDSNGGELMQLGFTGWDWSGEGGFEIIGTNLGFAIQYGYNRINAASPSNGFDNTLESAYRLHYVNLSNGKATSYGRTRPLIGLTIR